MVLCGYMAHPGGRPLKFKSVEELQAKINEYFDFCDARIIQVFSKKIGDVVEVNDPAPYTMAGLAYALGIDRDTLLSYGKKEEFSGAVKRARDRVHSDVEQRLMEKAPTGAIFNLKNNFGWRDQTEVKQQNEHTINVRNMSDEELRGILDSYLNTQKPSS